MPTESALLENVVKLEEAKVSQKQVSWQAFIKFAIFQEEKECFLTPSPIYQKFNKIKIKWETLGMI